MTLPTCPVTMNTNRCVTDRDAAHIKTIRGRFVTGKGHRTTFDVKAIFDFSQLKE